ncbi:hypothetical protein MRX96_041754 [Rhipicephalus microplus]
MKLVAEDDSVRMLANGALNPSPNTLYYWFKVWRKDHYGDTVDPLSKLHKKAPLYHQNGVSIWRTKLKDGSCWAGTSTSFMTDNSMAEKAAVLEVWPEATQLLCHFHVAPAEWCWLHASSNKISRDEKRELMTAFQKVMYVSSVEDLEAATEELLQ